MIDTLIKVFRISMVNQLTTILISEVIMTHIIIQVTCLLLAVVRIHIGQPVYQELKAVEEMIIKLHDKNHIRFLDSHHFFILAINNQQINHRTVGDKNNHINKSLQLQQHHQSQAAIKVKVSIWQIPLMGKMLPFGIKCPHLLRNKEVEPHEEQVLLQEVKHST